MSSACDSYVEGTTDACGNCGYSYYSHPQAPSQSQDNLDHHHHHQHYPMPSQDDYQQEEVSVDRSHSYSYSTTTHDRENSGVYDDSYDNQQHPASPTHSYTQSAVVSSGKPPPPPLPRSLPKGIIMRATRLSSPRAGPPPLPGGGPPSHMPSASLSSLPSSASFSGTLPSRPPLPNNLPSGNGAGGAGGAAGVGGVAGAAGPRPPPRVPVRMHSLRSPRSIAIDSVAAAGNPLPSSSGIPHSAGIPASPAEPHPLSRTLSHEPPTSPANKGAAGGGSPSVSPPTRPGVAPPRPPPRSASLTPQMVAQQTRRSESLDGISSVSSSSSSSAGNGGERLHALHEEEEGGGNGSGSVSVGNGNVNVNGNGNGNVHVERKRGVTEVITSLRKSGPSGGSVHMLAQQLGQQIGMAMGHQMGGPSHIGQGLGSPESEHHQLAGAGAGAGVNSNSNSNSALNSNKPRRPLPPTRPGGGAENEREASVIQRHTSDGNNNGQINAHRLSGTRGSGSGSGGELKLPESDGPRTSGEIAGAGENFAGSEKRHKIREEIMQTESSYVTSLNLLHSIYVSAIENEKPNAKSYDVTERDMEHMKSNLETLRVLHLDFLAELGKNDLVYVARVMDKYADHFKMYTVYLNNYETCLEAITKMRKSKKGKAFMDTIETELTGVCGLNLSSYLIMPVQRIPRYVLLLKDLVRSSEESHPEYPHMIQALSKLENLAAHINEQKKKMDQRQKLAEVASRMSGVPTSFVIVQPHRQLIREGTLQVTAFSAVGTKQTLKVSDRYVFLFNDALILTKKHGDSLAWKGVLLLSSASVDFSQEASLFVPLDFTVSNLKMTVTFQCADQKEREEWIEITKVQIERLKKIRETKSRLQQHTRSRRSLDKAGSVHNLITQKLGTLKGVKKQGSAGELSVIGAPSQVGGEDGNDEVDDTDNHNGPEEIDPALQDQEQPL